jgi:hypothetical protein
MTVSILALLQLLAKTHVERTQDKEHDDDPQKDEVAHKISLTMTEIRATALIKVCTKGVKKLLTR